MSDTAWERTWALFHRASELPREERDAYLDASCNEPDLRQEVEALLRAAEAGRDFWDSPAALGGLLDATAGSDIQAGHEIGGYRLLRVVGEGGMGVVYEAEQAALGRRVALKLIKLGMDTREVVARFEAERQALALMEHPGIARVFDAAATDSGKPYFVMEFVSGESIDRACDRQQLSIDDRLRLFLQVCDAVQHAHRRGIIHRDLKPSNILLTAAGEPKIIDFGIAKAMDPQRTPRTLATAVGRFVGTPEYMSPEQASLAPDIDTRADVYALGVVLYELLVGALPLDLEDANYFEVQRRIQSEEPARPSSRLRRSGADADRAAHDRGIDSAGLRRRLTGELDWILMKALANDREQRYESVADFAADIRRYLARLPVLAGPPSRLYQARKLIQRRTAAVVAAALILAVLVTSSIVLGWQSHRLAEALEREAEQRAKADQVASFLVDLFQSQDPYITRGEDITGRELLERGIDRISGALGDQPLVEAELLATTGSVAYQLGDYAEASRLQEDALELRRRHLGPDHADVAASLRGLGLTHHASGDFAAAERRLRQALAVLDAGGGSLLERADVLLRLGVALQAQGDRDDAAELYDDALAAARQAGHAALEAEVLGRQASLALERRELAVAERSARSALELQERSFGPDDLRLTTTRSVLAHILHRAGDHAEAATVYRENLAEQERMLGDAHPAVGNTLNGLGAALYDGGRDAEAIPVLRRALTIFSDLGAEGRAQRSSALANLALVEHRRGEYEEAGRLHEEALAIDREIYGDESSKVAADLNNLGWLHHDAGNLERAESYYLQALALHRSIFGPEHPSAAFQLNNLAQLDHQRGRPDEAAARAEEALALRLAALPSDHALVAASRTTLGAALTALGRTDEAEPLLRRALATRRAAFGPDDWRTAESASALGECLAARGELEAALPLLRSGYEMLLATKGPNDRRTDLARARLESAG